MMIGSIDLYILILVLIDFDLQSRSQGCEKAKIFVPVISQKFSVEFGMGWWYTI